MEGALHTAHDSLRALIQASPLAIAALDLDGNVRMWNPAAERIFGWRESEVLGRPLPSVPADRQDEFRAFRQRVLQGETLAGVQVRRQKRDGSFLNIEFWTAPLHDARGNLTGIMGIMADVTERKRTEERLHLQSTALEAAASAIMITDRDGHIVWANPAFTRLTGYAFEEILGQTPRLFRVDQQDPATYRTLWETILSGRVWRGELLNRRKDGSLYLEGQTITPVRDNRGEISHFIAIKRDITEQQRAAEAIEGVQLLTPADLHESLDRIVEEASRIAGTPHVKVLLLDKETQVIRLGAVAGRPAAMLAGLQFPPGIGLSGIVVATRQPLFVADCQHDPRNVYAEQDRELGLVTYLGLPIEIRGAALGVLTFNTTAPKIYSPEELTYLTSFANQAAIAIENARLYETIRQHAATLEVRVQERTRELETTNDQLQEASRHKSEFLANMSHELRTPLNSVIGFSELLLGQGIGPLTDRQARFLGHIHESGKHLLQLINDILDLSKVEAGKLVLFPEALPVAQTLDDILVIARGLANKKSQEIQADIAPDLPLLTADPVRFKQVLFNLLSNAVKFTREQGRITLTARRVSARAEGSAMDAIEPRRERGVPGSWLKVEVSDTGIGIKADDLPRLFQEFMQLDASMSKRHEGTGLGLALTKRLVELHGGSIWAASKGEDRGATFTVILPFGGPGGPTGASTEPTSL